MDNYILAETLGKGATAKVKAAVDADGREWAIKIFDLTNPKFNSRQFERLKLEVEAT